VSVAPMPNELPESYEVIYEVAFKTMYFDPETEIIITVWNPSSEFITDENYRTDAEETVKLILDSEAKYMITDHRENKFQISDELQKWYASLIAHVLGNSGFEKCAVIITENLNLLSALEEIKSNIEEAEKNHTIQYRFFNEFKDAEKWILSK
jgi:hypothetical protein